MNRRRLQKRAFTLIELLVVIAIIAILAAILFPVFAQAKAAAKNAAAISNVKQLTLGLLMYSGDADDMRVLRNRQDIVNNAVVNEYNWKQLSLPYVKNQDIYRDPTNPASKYKDFHSDPAARAYFNWTPVTPQPNEVFTRGYAIANIWLNGFVDNKAVSITGLDDPANTYNIVESKTFFEDMGPYIGWTKNVDDDTSWLGAAAPKTGLQWNWGGDKWSNKAMVVGWQDGHAKRQAFSASCGKSFMTQPDGSTQKDVWGMSASEKAGYSWANANCDQLPAQFK